MRKKQRLVVCLDGTWNNKDDSTNVLHHYALAIERTWPEANAECIQTRFYGEGVGTGVLDGITGGGFGFGLEENVRAAYDWLVEHFHDADDTADADEIYIFGFSRGAYTARSLVGFIGTFGLLRRGSPLSVNQLWSEYCLLGRKRELSNSLWDRVFGDAPTSIRRINDLVVDPWNQSKLEGRQRRRGVPIVPGRLPGQLVDDLSVGEKLLVRWSRRVRITYLGIYDTVGAMGVDALAIPGIKSRLAMHHNLRATTLIQHCRHAFALDEHRSSFDHTPLAAFIGHGENDDDNQCNAMKRQDAARYWARKQAMWRRKIQQRWFTGAHSNIGGGYPDNELAQLPFKWLLEGARNAGLECEPIKFTAPMTMPKPRDSYAEFAKPFWTDVVRGKRLYRQLDPAPSLRASRGNSGKSITASNTPPPAGFSLRSINEQVDASTLQWAANEPDYQPPNLIEYARRKLAESPQGADSAILREICKIEPKHHWLGTSLTAFTAVVLWSTLAAGGFAALNALFTARQEIPSLWILACLALAMVLVDWVESWSNYWLAVDRSRAWRRALFDSIYWVRMLGFVAFVFGGAAALLRLWEMGWSADSFSAAIDRASATFLRWSPVLLAAAVGVVLANVLDRASKRRQSAGALGSFIAGPLAAFGAVVLVVALARLMGAICTPAFGTPELSYTDAAKDAKFAGLLILLQLAIGYLLNAFKWVGEPIMRPNLGSITKLQWCCTPDRVSRLLESWRMMLACRWSEEDQDAKSGPAAVAMREVVREALWRDMLGFIPLYLIVFTFGLWFAAHELGWQALGSQVLYIPLWILLPLFAAVTDYVEDACHFRYLTMHRRGERPALMLTTVSFLATLLKFVAFGFAFFAVAGALVVGTYHVVSLGEHTGWRGTVALLISTIASLLFVSVILGALAYRGRTWLKSRKP